MKTLLALWLTGNVWTLSVLATYVPHDGVGVGLALGLVGVWLSQLPLVWAFVAGREGGRR